jgi:hypothetical protein
MPLSFGAIDDAQPLQALEHLDRIGPHAMSLRSPSTRELRSVVCRWPSRSETKASCVPRFGYCPIPMMRRSRPAGHAR